MGQIAAAVRHMLAAGMAHDDVVSAIADMEQEVPKQRTAGAIRQERYRRNKASQVTESDVGDASLSPKEKSPTPSKEITPIPFPNSSEFGANPDPRDELWREGVATLKAITGKTDGSAKQIIGKWCRDAKDDCALILTKIRKAQIDRIGDPVSWITAAIRSTGPPKERTVHDVLDEITNGTWKPPGWDDDTSISIGN